MSEHDEQIGDDPILERMRLANPSPPTAPVEPVTGPQARALLEDVMQHSPEEDAPASGTRSRTLVLVGAAAATLVLVVGGALALGGDDDGDDVAATTAPTSAPAQEALELSFPEGDPTMQMCMAMSPEALAPVPLAFRGTVASITPAEPGGAGVATIEVDHWYKGGDAAVVSLEVLDGTTVALEGVELAEGGAYLITATDGMVNTCFSGEATPDLEAMFAEAFGG